MSLGAGRLAIVRQLLVESVLLATAGGVLGVALAHFSLDALMAFAPADLLRVPDLPVDLRVLLYTLGLSMLTGLVVGTGARPAGGPPVDCRLDSHGRIEADACAAYPAGSGRVSGRDDRHAAVRCRPARPDCPRAEQCGQRLRQARSPDDGNRAAPGKVPAGAPDPCSSARPLTALRALPGVEAAAAGNSLATIGSLAGGTVFHRLGTPHMPLNERPIASIRVVAPGYFSTLRHSRAARARVHDRR